jgi:glycine betaine/proline transport system substrate-binding protein
MYAQAAEKTIQIAHQSSPQCIMYATVLAEMLTYLGYDAKPVLLQGLAAYPLMESGEVQSFPCAWLPVQQSAWEKYVEQKKTVKGLALMTEECLLKFCVPKYVADQGIASIADLDKFADKFDKKLYTGEPGSGAWNTVKNTIENNIYGLGDWELVSVSWFALIPEMYEKYKREEWIAFTGWSPHWMNQLMELVFLEDPENTWGGASTIWNPGPANLEQEMPNVHKLIEQYKVSQGIANVWIYEHGFQKVEPPEAARKWIKENVHIVDIWTTGVTNKSGDESAYIAIRKALGIM